jgi:predicted transcriptional regulator
VRQYQALLDEVAELRDIHRGLADVNAGRVTSHADVIAEFLDDTP